MKIRLTCSNCDLDRIYQGYESLWEFWHTEEFDQCPNCWTKDSLSAEEYNGRRTEKEWTS